MTYKAKNFLIVALLLGLVTTITGCPKNWSPEKIGDQVHLQTKRVAIAVFGIYDPLAERMADKRIAGEVPEEDWVKIQAIDDKIVATHNELVAGLKAYEKARRLNIFNKPDLQNMLLLSANLWELYEEGKEMFQAFGVIESPTRISMNHNYKRLLLSPTMDEIKPIITISQKVHEKEIS